MHRREGEWKTLNAQEEDESLHEHFPILPNSLSSKPKEVIFYVFYKIIPIYNK